MVRKRQAKLLCSIMLVLWRVFSFYVSLRSSFCNCNLEEIEDESLEFCTLSLLSVFVGALFEGVACLIISKKVVYRKHSTIEKDEGIICLSGNNHDCVLLKNKLCFRKILGSNQAYFMVRF